jgi:hypothetical protein
MELYFCINLQRSGNTLLGSILNQNPNITFTANSPLTEIIHQLHLIKTTDTTALNFPDTVAFDNLITKSFYSYSETYKTPYVINRSNWGAAGNLKLLEKYFDKEIKFLILYRNPLECLASILKSHKIKKENSYKEAEYYMDIEKGPLGNVVHQIKIIKNNYKHLLVNYNQIVNSPKETIDKIYKFFSIPAYNHSYKNLKQFELQGTKYDDSIFGDVDLHTIRTDKIERKKYAIEDFLLPSVIKKYKYFGIEYES